MDRIRRILFAVVLIVPVLGPVQAMSGDGSDGLRAAPRACCGAACHCEARSSCGCQMRTPARGPVPEPAAPAAPTLAPTAARLPHPVEAVAATATLPARPLHRPVVEAYKHPDRLLDLLCTLVV